MRNDANMSVRDIHGDLPLFIAVKASNDDAVEEFLRDGYDLTVVNWNRQTALHLSCIAGSLPVTRKLIERDAPTDSRDVFGNTALHYATMGDFQDLVNVLLSRGADATLRNAQNKSPFFYASIQTAKLFRHHFQTDGAFDRLVTAAQTQAMVSPPHQKPIQKSRKGGTGKEWNHTPKPVSRRRKRVKE
jgi:ankyrin repeat protein